METQAPCGEVIFKFVFPQTKVTLKMFSHVILLHDMIVKSLYMMKNIGNQKLSQILNTVDLETEASILQSG